MQAQFIKEDRINDRTIYYTEIDNRYVEGSVSYREEEGRKFFDHIVKHGSMTPTRTLLGSHPISQVDTWSVEPIVTSETSTHKDLEPQL